MKTKARKSHECRICGQRIAKGEMHVAWSGLDTENGGWCRLHMHLDCEEYSREWDADDWSCCGPGDVSRAEVREQLRHQVTVEQFVAGDSI